MINWWNKSTICRSASAAYQVTVDYINTCIWHLLWFDRNGLLHLIGICFLINFIRGPYRIPRFTYHNIVTYSPGSRLMMWRWPVSWVTNWADMVKDCIILRRDVPWLWLKGGDTLEIIVMRSQQINTISKLRVGHSWPHQCFYFEKCGHSHAPRDA